MKTAGVREECGQLEIAVVREQERLAEIDRTFELIRLHYRKHLLAGDERKADLALGEIERVVVERVEQRESLAAAQARAGEWRDVPEMDIALDYYNDLVSLVRGRLNAASGASELNAALHDLLNGAWLDADDTGRLHAKFVLREAAPTVDGRRMEWLDVLQEPTPEPARTPWSATRLSPSSYRLSRCRSTDNEHRCATNGLRFPVA